MSGSLRNYLATIETYRERRTRDEVLTDSHVVLTPGGAGIANMQQEFGTGTEVADVTISGAGAADCVREHREPRVWCAAWRAARRRRSAWRLERSGSRLIRQMLTESVVLSCLGGIAGLAVAYGGTQVLLAMAFPDATNLPIDANPSPPVLAFAFRTLAADRTYLRRCAGVGHLTLATGRGSARIEPVDAAIVLDGCSDRW